MEIVYGLMRSSIVIINISTSNKGQLKGKNDLREMRFMLVNNEFRDHFIGHITETNRPELLNSSRVRDIGD